MKNIDLPRNPLIPYPRLCESTSGAPQDFPNKSWNQYKMDHETLEGNTIGGEGGENLQGWLTRFWASACHQALGEHSSGPPDIGKQAP